MLTAQACGDKAAYAPLEGRGAACGAVLWLARGRWRETRGGARAAHTLSACRHTDPARAFVALSHRQPTLSSEERRECRPDLQGVGNAVRATLLSARSSCTHTRTQNPASQPRARTHTKTWRPAAHSPPFPSAQCTRARSRSDQVTKHSGSRARATHQAPKRGRAVVVPIAPCRSPTRSTTSRRAPGRQRCARWATDRMGAVSPRARTARTRIKHTRRAHALLGALLPSLWRAGGRAAAPPGGVARPAKVVGRGRKGQGPLGQELPPQVRGVARGRKSERELSDDPRPLSLRHAARLLLLSLAR